MNLPIMTRPKGISTMAAALVFCPDGEMSPRPTVVRVAESKYQESTGESPSRKARK